jgi:type IV pilus assembly protein PilA
MAMQPPGQPYYPQAQQPPPKKKMSTCLVVGIVLLVISVPMIGIMAALGIYGVRKYLASAKTAEAKNTIGAIARSAVAAYESEAMPGGKPAHRLCASASPVPSFVPAAKKYQASTAAGADYNAGSATAGWPCLKFELTQPAYYQYGYVTGAGSGKSGATANGFEATARGDLDGNGVSSLFARGADVRNGSIVLATNIYIENEFE